MHVKTLKPRSSSIQIPSFRSPLEMEIRYGAVGRPQLEKVFPNRLAGAQANPPKMKDDPSVPRRDVHYPSMPEPSAPPMAQPVYHYSNPSQYAPPPQQYVPPHQQPLIQQPIQAPMAVMYEPPAYSGDYREEGCCGMIFKLVLFHFMNAILGIGAYSIVVAGVSISFGLLPLCCFGIVVFRLVLYAVRFFAQLDVELYNYISPPQEHVYLSIPARAAFQGLEGRRLSPSLSSVSPLSIMATLYFLTIKFALGIVSLVVLALAVAFPIAQIASDDDDIRVVLGANVQDFNMDTDPVAYSVVCVSLFIISLALMHIAARLSRTATRFFCCERFSTYRYVQSASFPPPNQYPVATSAYGSTSSYN